MALDPVVNFFRSTIATLPVASGGTSIVLQTGDGNKLPNPSVDGAFNLTIYNADDQFVTPEIVRVTARATDTLTVTRAQEGTSATNKTAGNTWNVELTATAKTIQDIDTAKLDVADVVNNLTSTDTDKALSANQGKVLQDGKLNLSGGTMTGDLTIPDKIIHAGDTNTAIRFPANDTVTVETAGVERLRVTGSGNVGIGTSQPHLLFAVGNTGMVGGDRKAPDASGTTVPIYTITCSGTTNTSRYNAANGVLKVAIGSRFSTGNVLAAYTVPFLLSRNGRATGVVTLTLGTPTLLQFTVNVGETIDTVTVALSSATNTGATMDITIAVTGDVNLTDLDFNTSLEITQHNEVVAPFTITKA